MRSRALAAAILALILTPAMALAAPVTLHRGGSSSSSTTSVSGVYSITFNVTVASTLPTGSTIVCKAQIAPNAQQNYFSSQTQAVPVETASAVATVSGTTATCAIEIPFSWTLSNASSLAALAYEIDAYNASGTLPAVVRVSSQSGVATAYPSSGATSSLTFNVTF